MTRFFAAFLTVLIAVAPAHAQWGGGNVAMLNPQVLPANASAGLPAVDDNFAAGGNPVSNGICAEYGHQVPCTSHYSISRASTKYCAGLDGIWTQVVSSIGCLTNQGYLIEEARTNNALRARDMTQAAWVAVGTGTALNAVGIDGTANSASTLTATGTASSCTASCTILQTLTLGSAADTYSVWLKRVTGTGAVNITINNLVGTTACTLVTTSFTRCSVTATLANPVIGIQMTALNDVIIADVNQLETGAFPTSPIPTTTVSVTRAADAVTVSGVLNSLLATGVSSIFSSQTIPGLNTPANPSFIVATGGGGGSDRRFYSSGNTTVSTRSNDATVLSATVGGAGTFASGLQIKSAIAYDASGRSIVANNGTLTTDAKTFGTYATATIGAAGASNFLNAYFQRNAIWPSRLSDATLKATTQ